MTDGVKALNPLTIPKPKGYHDLHVGPLPLRRLRLFVMLADDALWRCSVLPVIKDRLAYYEETGWYENAEDALVRGGRDLAKKGQPTGNELRGLLLANEEWEAVNECHWRKLKPTAKHVSGPKTEPPDDLMWAVTEQGGAWEIFTTITQEEQYKMFHFWRDKP